MAGILDGEGHIGINRSKACGNSKSDKYALVIGISNTYLPVVELFAEHFGGDIQPRKGINKPIYIWRCSSKRAGATLSILMPYLMIKKEQAKIAIAYIEKHCTGSHGRLLTQEILDNRESFKLSIVNARRKSFKTGVVKNAS